MDKYETEHSDYYHLKPEHELFILLAQFRTVDKKRISELLATSLDWIEILGYLSFHRIAGLAYKTLLENYFLEVQSQAFFHIKMINCIQAIRVRNNRKYIEMISKRLIEKQIPHAFLKGSILANTIYPEGARVSNDIDILVNPKDITRCGNILQSLGFIQGVYNYTNKQIKELDRREIIYRRMNWGEVVPFLKVVNEDGIEELEVDINFSLDWLPVGTEKTVESFLENAETYKIDEDIAVHSLDKETFLIHLCMHLYKEAILFDMVIGSRDLDFYKFVDIFTYITNIKFDWKKFISTVKKFNLHEGCYYSLEYTKIFFPCLNENVEFINTLTELKPSDTSYLDEVIDPAKPKIKYVWQEDLLTRFFDMKRYKKLREIKA